MDKSAVEAIVAAHLPGYVEAMGLGSWKIAVTYGPIADPDGASATCTRNVLYDKAEIRIDPEHEEHATEAGVLESLRHELFHIIISPFDQLWWHVADGLKADSPELEQARNIWQFATERAVIHMERFWQSLEACHRRQDGANPTVNGAVPGSAPRIEVGR